MIHKVSQHLHARSAALLVTIEQRLSRIFVAWMMIVAVAGTARLATGPAPFQEALSTTAGTYLLLAFAPIASALLALRWFEGADSQPQPALRLARIGRWHSVPISEARRHPLYGTNGIMVSLLVGILLNVAFRTAEFLLAIPPIPSTAPAWVQSLQIAMAFDAVLFSSLYAIAFVVALKRAPLFPRLLGTIWLADIVTQLAIASVMGADTSLPPNAAFALQQLLFGAIQKVLISIMVWSPYLILSKRVNVTYRHRIPA